ncbi:MAG: 23S rRNA (pseudouridine(1915)-N(3))-methyltransferase RlmH [Betaproteobacteria bacterium]|nr:23S rRNA (pseudouridine(1915)-N(3))-methyltransferase RlmH [Betaproteobacteria bacterium]
MKLTIVALGHKLPTWMQGGFDEYAKRMPPEARIEMIELKPEDRANRSVDKVLALEAARLETTIPKAALRIILDERGVSLTTRQLADWLLAWQAEGVSPCFVIGSADGLDANFKKSARRLVSLSGCTLPHGLARVMLVEQLYRAWSLTQNHPYHRE